MSNSEDDIELTDQHPMLEDGEPVRAPKRRPKTTASCRVMLGKAVVISVVGILIVLMMIELWSDYGNVWTTRTLFPPKVHSLSEHCPPEAVGQLNKAYNTPTCEWKNTTYLDCEADLPENPYVVAAGKVHLDRDHFFVKYAQPIDSCQVIVVWAI